MGRVRRTEYLIQYASPRYSKVVLRTVVHCARGRSQISITDTHESTGAGKKKTKNQKNTHTIRALEEPSRVPRYITLCHVTADARTVQIPL